MPKCVFCGKDSPGFKGTHRITNDGVTSYFCGSKCMNNVLKLKRDKRKVRWTEAFHEVREKQRVRAKEKAGAEKQKAAS